MTFFLMIQFNTLSLQNKQRIKQTNHQNIELKVCGSSYYL